MKDEKANDVTATADNTATDASAAPAATAAAPAKVADDAQVPADAKKGTSSDSSGDDIAALRAASEQSKIDLAEANAKIAALEQDALDKWIGDSTANLAGEVEANKTILGSLVASHGKDSAEVKAFLENQAALTEQLTAGGLFKEIGKGGSDTDNSAERQLDAKAKELMAKDSKLTKQQALTEAYEQNPDLYQAMQDGN